MKNGTFESRQAIVKINRLEKLLIEKGIVSGVELQDAELTCHSLGYNSLFRSQV